jgi:uridine phosphorylase
MQNNEPVVNPQKTARSAELGSVAVMAATKVDFQYLCEILNFTENDFQYLFQSRLYSDRHNAAGYSVTGPFVGAPYAVMLLENLIARGARQFIFLGWCGAISDNVKIGDMILPTAAYIDEGTSKHYGATDNLQLPATSTMGSQIRQALENNDRDYHEGTVWTTDAVYRETRLEVAAHQQNGILAVEMEFSALLSVAQFRGVDLAGILVVSDELSSLNWRPGFKHDRFVQSRKTACRLVAELLCDAGSGTSS